jgi:hypothetical protein
MIRPRTVTTDDARSHVETPLAGLGDVFDDAVGRQPGPLSRVSTVGSH